MLNQLVLVGRLNDDFKVEEKDGKKVVTGTLAVPSSHKDKDGVYQTDFIPFSILGNMADTTYEYCKKGDLLGIKGSIKTFNGKMQVLAERVTFLSQDKSIIDKNTEIDKKI